MSNRSKRNLPRVGCAFLATTALVLFVMFVLHRIGDGDSYDRASSAGTTEGFGPVVSPRDGTLLFASLRTGRGDLYTADANGQNVWRLTTDAFYEGSPVFSPDGTQIAFIKEVPQRGSINVYRGEAWIMKADGSNSHAVTHDNTDYTGPVFSSDGKSLFLTRLTPDFAVNRAAVVRVVLGSANRSPQLAAEDDSVYGGDLISRSGAKRYLVQGDDKARTNFIWLQEKGRPGKPDTKTRLHEGWSPGLSPDEKTLAFISAPYSQTLWFARASDGKFAHVLLNTGNTLSSPCFSRDGNWLFFGEANGSGPISISKVSVAGKGYARVARIGR